MLEDKIVKLQSSLKIIDKMYEDMKFHIIDVNNTLIDLANDIKNHKCIVAQTNSLIKLNEKVKAIFDNSDIIERMIGCDNILTEYLDPSILEDGVGVIKPSITFLQYESDINKLSPARLSNWPSGFYRNNETKETQLLIVTKQYIYVFDGLPGSRFKLYIAIGVTISFEEAEFFEIAKNFSDINLADILITLKNSLEEIKTKHIF